MANETEIKANSEKLENGKFMEALNDVKVPLLPLDQKWHHLFMGIEKTKEIKAAEEKVDELLKLQGKLNDDLKNLKKVKNNLMSSIVDNMDDSDAGEKKQRDKKMEENRKLIDEANSKMEEIEDKLLELPRELDAANKVLMVLSMDICYKKLRDNAIQIEEIGSWIKKMRIELKKNIIIKQANEHKNEEIYAYMHDILGPKALDVFDLKYDEDGQVLDK
ncbi:MAG: hypothetical protein IKX99_02170 [Lachnospiraceae bacterium]|nr:hypothetical protein [Lachnospiraceae bacterium]MBO4461577.1 hypothetical protein [Lachnospiraceae bacterium]MBR4795528.1 hypothetical protein [Lachnospiraceae bacterium]MBR5788896.1 hypothetical protein [Lachnospiraceae bacterium]